MTCNYVKIKVLYYQCNYKITMQHLLNQQVREIHFYFALQIAQNFVLANNSTLPNYFSLCFACTY